MHSKIFTKSKLRISLDKQKQLRFPSGEHGIWIGKAMFEGNAGVIDRAIQHIKRDDNQVFRICDIGCGPGYSLLKLAEKFPKAEIVGVDPSSEMIQMSYEVKKDFGLNCDLVQDSLPELSLDDNYFDYVMLINIVYFLDNLEESLVEVRRILKQDGSIIVYMTDRQSIEERIDFSDGVYNSVEKTQMIDLLRKLGFRDLGIDTFERKIGETGHVLKATKG